MSELSVSDDPVAMDPPDRGRRLRPAPRLKAAIRRALPLALRRRLAIWVGRQRWISSRAWWTQELLRDMAEQQPDAYHSFLWTHHLAYASSYEVEHRFGGEQIHPTRHLLFEQMNRNLVACGIRPEHDVRSVLEVGCSMGYLLRHLETMYFPGARVLDGVDIDEYAVEAGVRHLEREGSRVRLLHGDMRELAAVLGRPVYDVGICAGVLMYLEYDQAAHVVEYMLRHTRGLVVLAGLAHPHVDNRLLQSSERRESDQSFIHNLDAMVQAAGGTIVDRRWEGARVLNGNTIYFIYCRPS